MTPAQAQANAVMGALYEPTHLDVLRKIGSTALCVFRTMSKSGKTWRVYHYGPRGGMRIRFDWVYPHLWEPTGERCTKVPS